MVVYKKRQSAMVELCRKLSVPYAVLPPTRNLIVLWDDRKNT